MEKTVIPRPQLRKIPGSLMPLAKETHTKDLKTLNRIELMEIIEREANLLANKSMIAKLPDKGKRIREHHDRVREELNKRESVDATAALFSKLNIVASGKNILNDMEWNGGRVNGNFEDPSEDLLDSDDEPDPLRIIATRTMHERQPVTVVLPPEKSLITAEDLAEIKSFHKDTSDSNGPTTPTDEETNENAASPNVVDAELIEVNAVEQMRNLIAKQSKALDELSLSTSSSDATSLNDVDQHVRYLVKKTELTPADSQQREKFKPYKTLINPEVNDPAKARALKEKNKYWEVTAATPPPLQHSGTKMLTLMDSMQIQENYMRTVKEMQLAQAFDLLEAKIKRQQQRYELPDDSVLKTKSSFTTYRNPAAAAAATTTTTRADISIEGKIRKSEKHEVFDPADEEKSGCTISYAVYD